jgi:hypothetical protein
MARNPPLAFVDANILLPFEPFRRRADDPRSSLHQENHAGSVCAYDEADTYVVQSGNVRLSFLSKPGRQEPSAK